MDNLATEQDLINQSKDVFTEEEDHINDKSLQELTSLTKVLNSYENHKKEKNITRE